MDDIVLKMQKKIIENSELRLNKKLKPENTSKIFTYTSCIGLEMIIDSVQSIAVQEIECYLNEL